MRAVKAPVALAILYVASGCGESTAPMTSSANSAPSTAATAPKAIPAVDAVDRGLVVSGPIIVEHQVDITAQRDGVVQKIQVDAPNRVRAGSLLAMMDDRQTLANLEAARAKSRSIAADLKNWQSEAEVLQADFVRAKRLWDLGLTSEEQLQHAKYKADSDQWDIERVKETLNTAHQEERSLELELEKAKIVAPFDGLVARRYVREGQSVAKGDRLFWVTAEAPLLMRFALPERFFGHVRAGQQYEITSPDVPGEKHTAKVKQISPVIDPSSGTFEVLVELIGTRGTFRPGMTANLRVENSH